MLHADAYTHPGITEFDGKSCIAKKEAVFRCLGHRRSRPRTSLHRCRNCPAGSLISFSSDALACKRKRKWKDRKKKKKKKKYGSEYSFTPTAKVAVKIPHPIPYLLREFIMCLL